MLCKKVIYDNFSADRRRFCAQMKIAFGKKRIEILSDEILSNKSESKATTARKIVKNYVIDAGGS